MLSVVTLIVLRMVIQSYLQSYFCLVLVLKYDQYLISTGGDEMLHASHNMTCDSYRLQ